MMRVGQVWARFALLLPFFGYAAAQQTTFKTQSPLVVVPVAVYSNRGEPVWGLKESDFALFDNGQERKVTVEPWGTYESRVALAVVIETGTLSQAALLKVKKMASLLDGIIGENGEVAVVTADSEVQTRLNFTTRWEAIQETFEKLRTRGGGAGRTLDGVDAAISLFASRSPAERRLLLLLSRPFDRDSKAKASEVLTHAQEQNVAIYAATYSAFVTPFTTKASELEAPEGGDLVGLFLEISRAAKRNMSVTLPEYTGGRHLGFETVRGLERDLTEIGNEVHSQYQLSFVAEPEKNAVYHTSSL
jgi:VWFA-related protein